MHAPFHAYAEVWVGSTAILAVILLVSQWGQMSAVARAEDFLYGLDMNVLCYTLLLCLATFVLGASRVIAETMADAHDMESCTWLIVSTSEEGCSMRITFPVEEFGTHIPARDEFVQKTECWSDELEAHLSYLMRTYAVWMDEREFPSDGRVILTLDAWLSTRRVYNQELAMAQEKLKASDDMTDIVAFMARFHLTCTQRGDDTFVGAHDSCDRFIIGGEGTLWLDDFPCVNVACHPLTRVRLVLRRVRQWPVSRVREWLLGEEKEKREKEEAKRAKYKRTRTVEEHAETIAEVFRRHLGGHTKDQPAAHACVELVDDDEPVGTSVTHITQ